MKDFEIEVASCDEIYWASTTEYTITVNDKEHTIRSVEDSNGLEMLYKSEAGWDNIYNYKEIPEVAAIIEALDEDDLDLYCA